MNVAIDFPADPPCYIKMTRDQVGHFSDIHLPLRERSFLAEDYLSSLLFERFLSRKLPLKLDASAAISVPPRTLINIHSVNFSDCARLISINVGHAVEIVT